MLLVLSLCSTLPSFSVHPELAFGVITLQSYGHGAARARAGAPRPPGDGMAACTEALGWADGHPMLGPCSPGAVQGCGVREPPEGRVNAEDGARNAQLSWVLGRFF